MCVRAHLHACLPHCAGALMELSQKRRGEYKDMKFLTENRVSIKYDLPLAEVRHVMHYMMHHVMHYAM